MEGMVITMFKKSKSFIILFVILTLLLTLAFTGCSKDADGQTATTTRAATTTTSSEPVTLRFLTQDRWDADYSWGSDHEYLNITYVENYLNIKIEWEVTTGGENFDNLLKTRFAAGVNLPDLAYLGWNMDNLVAMNLANQGLIIPLNDLIDQHGPDIKYIITEKVPSAKKEITAPDGNIYWIADIYVSEANHVKLIIRNDWLKKVGINEIPDTTDKFFEALKLFRDNDVNGDGKKNELFVPPYMGAVTISLGNAFGVEHGNIDADIRIGSDDNNKVYLSWLHPGSKEFLMYLNKMYEENLIAPELPIMTGEKWGQYLATDTMAAAHGWSSGLDGRNSAVLVEGAEPDYQFMPMLKGPNGDWGNFRFADGPQGPKFVITKDCKNPDAAMRFLNFYFTDHGILTKDWGVEGVTFEFDEDNEPRWTDDFAKKMEEDPNVGAAFGMWSSSFPTLWIHDYETTLKKAIKDNTAFALEKHHIPAKIAVDGPDSQDIKFGIPSNDDMKEFERIGMEFATYIDEMVLKFLFGQESFDNWDAFVAEANRLGGSDYIKRTQIMYDRYLSN